MLFCKKLRNEHYRESVNGAGKEEQNGICNFAGNGAQSLDPDSFGP
jgi:hypothetical protein